jgi:hypothetical protein
VTDAISGYEGMCRPTGFQPCVFVDGAFAGTISPEPMATRANGSGSVLLCATRAPTRGAARRAPRW